MEVAPLKSVTGLTRRDEYRARIQQETFVEVMDSTIDQYGGCGTDDS